VNPGTKETVVPPPNIQIHVKGLSLGAELKDKDGRSSLKLSYGPLESLEEDNEDAGEDEDDEPSTREIVLGSLTPGKVSHVFLYFGSNLAPLSSFRSSRLPWMSF